MKLLARIGATSLIAVLAGCTTPGPPEETPAATPRASREQHQNPASPEAAEPEPTPSFAQDGTTRVLTYGNVEVRATPGSDGIHTAVSVSNDTDEEATYQLRISVGDGEGWVAYKDFWFQSVAPGATGEDAALIGATHAGDIPEKPAIYIDRFEKVG